MTSGFNFIGLLMGLVPRNNSKAVNNSFAGAVFQVFYYKIWFGLVMIN